ncbi:hypothetical protein APA_3461 [Pseudanabaena sp. lw0831]|nr:hypothetical protein APA_3461 [Pseudanabaena sp. lw0831]
MHDSLLASVAAIATPISQINVFCEAILISYNHLNGQFLGGDRTWF